MSDLLNISLIDISINGGTQARTEINQSIVAEYAEALTGGAIFPPVVVFEDGASIWLADGFHRYHAHSKAELETINCDVRNGTQRDAILYSLLVNAFHGLRRTNDDKRKAVMTLLNDPEWNQWSQEKIAKYCGVSTGFVSKLVNDASLHSEEIKPVTRTVERNGKTYEQNTSNIGKTAATQKPVKEDLSTKQVGNSAEEYEEEEPNLVQIAEELQAENEALQRENKSLKTDDKDAELSRLNLLCDQLDGHRRGETNTKNEAQKQAKYYGDLLAKIRKVLNVDSNSKILAALEAR